MRTANMTFSLWLIGFTALIGSVSSARECPTPSAISPCICSVDGPANMNVACVNVDGQDLRRILANFKDYPVNLLVQLAIDDAELMNVTMPDLLFPEGNLGHELIITGRFLLRTPLVQFQPQSMTSVDGSCSLKQFQISKVNLAHFNASIFKDCKKLETIVLFGVRLESLISFPRLESLLLIGVNQLFQQKLITDLTADKVANLKTLAWKGDVDAELDFFEPFLNLSNIREIELANNAFNTVPDLTNCSSLSSISLSYEAPYLLTNQLSINLPLVGDPRNGLKVQISCILCREEHSISRLQGTFSNTLMVIDVLLDKLDESVWTPALTQGLLLKLGQYSPVECGCDLAWLVRQPKLIGRVEGACKDGRRFSQLRIDDFADCP